MTQRIFAFKGTFGQFETYTGSIPTQRLGAMFSAYFADALDANDPEPYNARGLSRLQVGKDKDALQDFAAAVNRNNQSAEFWTNLGIAQIRTGDVQRGRESINRALVLKPGYGPARQALSSAPAQG